ncbi:MAG: MoxR family ATPase [Lachnospiraceae bacterium]|nr:MoxR family ATPase [Lachnospiraceae bacterium]
MTLYEKTVKIREEVGKVIKGKDDVIKKVLMAILAQGHVLLDDVPGVGKTTLARAFSRALGISVKRVQFTPDTMPSDIIGFSAYDMKTGELKFHQGVIMTNLLLADEINRTSSKTQSALLEAREERQVTVDGVTHVLERPFTVIATQNPVGTAGTQMLPAAQLDRFLVRLTMGYPDAESQIEIMRDRHAGDPLELLEAVTDIDGLNRMIEEAAAVHVDDRIYSYVSDLMEATRNNEFITLGVSPRGGLAVCRTAKAAAYMEGRDYVIPADVSGVFSDVCAHRLVLQSKARLHEHTARQLIEDILKTVERPDTEGSPVK